MYLHRDRGAVGDGDSVALHAQTLGGIVTDEVEGSHTQVIENLRAGAEFTGISWQAEGKVRVDGVGALILELVGTQLGQQSDATPLMAAHVHHHATSGFVDHP